MATPTKGAPAAALSRTQRSFDVRARKLMEAVLAAFDQTESTDRQPVRLEHQLARLNETALIADGQLANPVAVADGSSSQRIHQKLFDAELALNSLAGLSPLMSESAIAPDQRREARQALLAVTQDDIEAAKDHAERLLALVDADPGNAHGTDATELVVPYRFATSILALLHGIAEWDTLCAEEETATAFKPSVTLLGGALPGAALVSAKVSANGPGGITRGFRSQFRLAPYTRAALQVAVAASVAITLGDQRSGRRFYWALLAVFVTFMGTSNASEQLRKALLRVAGTVVGITAGDLLAHAVGADHPYWTITVVLVAMFFAIYLMQINYFFMVVGLTVTLSQLYVQADEFTNSLLLVRLEETGIGAAVIIVVVTLILPLRTRDVLRHSLHDLMTAVAHLTTDASAVLAGESSDNAALREGARIVDAAYQASLAAAGPIRRDFTGHMDQEVQELLRYAGATRHYSRSLVADVAAAPAFDTESRASMTLGSTALRDGLDAIAEAIIGTRDGVYQSSDRYFADLERGFEHHGTSIGARLAVQDLHHIDTAATQLAGVLGLSVIESDQAPSPAPPPDIQTPTSLRRHRPG